MAASPEVGPTGAASATGGVGTSRTAARCIAVRVGAALYGLDLEEVQEVIELRPLTRVFRAPPAMAGVASLRGEVLPVIDLAVLLGLERRAGSGHGSGGCIVVVRERAGERRRAGLLVDELRGLRDVPDGGLGSLPAAVEASLGEIGVGVIPDPPPCTVIRVSAVLDAPVLAGLKSAAAD